MFAAVFDAVAAVAGSVVHAEKFMWIDVIFGITYLRRQCLNVIVVVQLHVRSVVLKAQKIKTLTKRRKTPSFHPTGEKTVIIKCYLSVSGNWTALFIFQFHSNCSSMGKCAVHFRLMGLIEIKFWFRSVISECNTSVIHNCGCLFIYLARCFSAMKDMLFSRWFAQRLFSKRIYPFGMVREFGQTNQFSELWKKKN